MNWGVYLLECADGTYYCGATNNIQKRLEAHNKGKGAKYTRGRLPVTLIALRCGLTKGAALSLERRVKKARRDRKEDVLMADDCQWCGKPTTGM